MHQHEVIDLFATTTDNSATELITIDGKTVSNLIGSEEQFIIQIKNCFMSGDLKGCQTGSMVLRDELGEYDLKAGDVIGDLVAFNGIGTENSLYWDDANKKLYCKGSTGKNVTWQITICMIFV